MSANNIANDYLKKAAADKMAAAPKSEKKAPGTPIGRHAPTEPKATPKPFTSSLTGRTPAKDGRGQETFISASLLKELTTEDFQQFGLQAMAKQTGMEVVSDQGWIGRIPGLLNAVDERLGHLASLSEFIEHLLVGYQKYCRLKNKDFKPRSCRACINVILRNLDAHERVRRSPAGTQRMRDQVDRVLIRHAKLNHQLKEIQDFETLKKLTQHFVEKGYWRAFIHALSGARGPFFFIAGPHQVLFSKQVNLYLDPKEQEYWRQKQGKAIELVMIIIYPFRKVDCNRDRINFRPVAYPCWVEPSKQMIQALNELRTNKSRQHWLAGREGAPAAPKTAKGVADAIGKCGAPVYKELIKNNQDIKARSYSIKNFRELNDQLLADWGAPDTLIAERMNHSKETSMAHYGGHHKKLEECKKDCAKIFAQVEEAIKEGAELVADQDEDPEEEEEVLEEKRSRSEPLEDDCPSDLEEFVGVFGTPVPPVSTPTEENFFV